MKFLGLAVSQRLIGTPSGATKHIEYGKDLAVTCSPDSTSTPINLRWYGPNDYDPAASEPKLIKSRGDMPAEEDGSYSRYEEEFVSIYEMVIYMLKYYLYVHCMYCHCLSAVAVIFLYFASNLVARLCTKCYILQNVFIQNLFDGTIIIIICIYFLCVSNIVAIFCNSCTFINL